MESQSSFKTGYRALVAGGAALAMVFFCTNLYAQHRPITMMPTPHTPPLVTPKTAQALPSLGATSSPPEYQQDRPQPLMHGEGFNYDLYYNYRLTPHIILRPNLQQTTKPGSVEDDSQRFVGGLSAGIQF